MKTKLFCLGFLALVVGCDHPSSSDKDTAGFQVIHATSDMQITATSAQGAGILQAHSKLSGINSKEHFSFHATFLNEQSQVILHTHSLGLAFDSGVQTRFRRDGADLVVELTPPGERARELYKEEGVFSESNEIHLRAELHDGNSSGLRLLIWWRQETWPHDSYKGEAAPRGSNAAFDTDSEDLWFPSHGQGVRWGFTLAGVTIREVQRERAHVK